MRRLVFTLLLGATFAPASLGQAPDFLWHFHLLPRHSFVRETGGIAGVNNLYRARGEYDFLRLWNGTGGFSAKFDNAEIWGSRISDDPVIATVLDVDEVFNLEGLRGELIPTMNPLADIYRFTGFTGDERDSSSVDLFAFQRGPWMLLAGSTTAPPGSADFFEYNIKALARTRPWADMNGDDRVNIVDYTHIRDNLGSDMGGVTLADWKEQFGEVPPDMDEMEAELLAAIGSGLAAATQIPEPLSIVLVMIGAACLIAVRTS